MWIGSIPTKALYGRFISLTSTKVFRDTEWMNVRLPPIRLQ